MPVPIYGAPFCTGSVCGIDSDCEQPLCTNKPTVSEINNWYARGSSGPMQWGMCSVSSSDSGGGGLSTKLIVVIVVTSLAVVGVVVYIVIYKRKIRALEAQLM